MPDITRLSRGRENEFEVEIVEAVAGEKSPRESHDFKELIIIERGDATAFVGDRRHDLTAPSLIVVEPGVEHSVAITSETATIIVAHDKRA